MNCKQGLEPLMADLHVKTKEFLMRFIALFLFIVCTGQSSLISACQEEIKMINITDKYKDFVIRDTINYVNHTAASENYTRTNNRIDAIGNGLREINSVEEKLKRADYVSVLTDIWSESDFNRRKNWLEAKAHEGHPLLMIEYGKMLAFNSIEEGLKWCYLGAFRAQQDAYCCDCEQFSILGRLIVQDVPIQLFEISERLSVLNVKITSAVAMTAKSQAIDNLKKWENYPSPEWITYSAPNAQPGSVKLKAASEWQKMREQVIKELEQKLMEEKQKLNIKHTIGSLASLKPLCYAVCLGLGVSISLYFLKRYFSKPAQY